MFAVALAGFVSMLLLLMGGLAFAQATLTLPGIAGIILTVGMAVDANILIFDRDPRGDGQGRNVKQSAKNGFDLAFSTIFDANLTTLLTAIMLYNVGTGPVRGFAVDPVVRHPGLDVLGPGGHPGADALRPREEPGPVYDGQMMAGRGDRLLGFISKAKTCAASARSVAIVGGVALFIVHCRRRTKLSIDFTRRLSEIQVRTGEPADTARFALRQARRQSRATSAGPEVKPLVDTAAGTATRGFRIDVQDRGHATRGAADEPRCATAPRSRRPRSPD